VKAEKVKRPGCSGCGTRSSQKYLVEHEGLCSACYRIKDIPDYDDRKAAKLVQRLWRDNGRWDRVLTGIRPLMKPPTPAGWRLVEVIQLDNRALVNWPV
jgi:hypothetical protein